MRRLSTLTFARQSAASLDGGAKLLQALDHPQVPEILETMDAHDCARFFLLFPYQLFKTLLGQLHLCRDHYVRGRPALWYSPTAEFAKQFAKLKLNTLFDAVPALQAITPDDRSDDATLYKKLAGGGSHIILSAETDAARHGKSAADIYRDETHLYKAGWAKQISARRGSYPDDYTETDMTTGLIHGTDGHHLWLTTDQRTWHWRCPACGHLHAPAYEIKDEASGERRGGIVYTRAHLANGLPDPVALARTLAYQCPACRTRFPDTPATRTAFNGTVAQPRGRYLALNPSPEPRAFGWRCHGVALRAWLPMVMRFELALLAKARGDLGPLSECIMDEFGDIWDPEKYFRPDQHNRYQHATPVYDLSPDGGTRTPRLDEHGKPLYAATPYRMEEPWPAELTAADGRPFRFATIDVQIDHYYLVIRSWGPFSQSRLWYTAKCLSVSEIALHCARANVPPYRTYFDSRHDSQRIRTIAARAGYLTLMGDKALRDYTHPDGIKRVYDVPKAIDAFTGIALETRTESACVEILFSKNSALDRLAVMRDPENRHPFDGTPLWTAASDAPDWYFAQINAHYRTRVEEKDGGHHFVWGGQKDDHAADCEAMQVIAASIAELTGLESLPAAEPSTEKKK